MTSRLRRAVAHHQVVISGRHIDRERRGAPGLAAVLELDAPDPGGQGTAGPHERRHRLIGDIGAAQGGLDGPGVGGIDRAASPHRIHVLSLDTRFPHVAAHRPAGHAGTSEITNRVQR